MGWDGSQPEAFLTCSPPRSHLPCFKMRHCDKGDNADR